MNRINVISLFFIGSACLQIAQSDTLVEARSTLVSVTHKPSDDTIILHHTGIQNFQECLAECNRYENCSTIVFREGAGCSLYNSSRLTEPLAEGEEAATVTARDMMYRPEINECLADVCNGSPCTDLPKGYKCDCLSGYTGEACETDSDECSASPCENGGTCTDLVNSYSCSCQPGYEGGSCETDIDECRSSPCGNGGTCTDLVNSYTCSCLPGFTGQSCETEARPPTCTELGSATAVAVYDVAVDGLDGISISSINGLVAVADYKSYKVHVMDAELNAQKVINQNYPAGTTYDDKGSLYVTDSSGHNVHVYDSNGIEISSFGSFGTGYGQFDRPHGITYKSGVLPELYVCDRYNYRVQVLHTNGTFIAEFGASHFGYDPRYIAVDTNIYVSDGDGTLFIFTSTYTLVDKSVAYQSPLYSFVRGIALYNGCLIVVDRDSGSIKVFDDNYSLVTTIGSSGTSVGQLSSPEGIAVTPLGAIYVVDRMNNRVQLFKVK